MRALLGSILVTLSLATATVAVAQTPPDVVETVDGGIVRGTIVENVPGDHVTIQLVTGEIRVLPAGSVLRVTMGAAAPPPAAIMAPLPPPVDPGVTLHVTGTSPGLMLHRLTATATVTVWTGNGVGGALIDQFEPICAAPCDATVPPGTYTMGISSDGGTPRRAGHAAFNVDRDLSLQMEYESREGIRIGGWFIFGVGTAAFLGLTLAPLFTGGTDDLITFLGIGGAVYAVTLIPFFIMAFMNDHADVYEIGEGIRF